jgi:large subunit ribosomal protein L20
MPRTKGGFKTAERRRKVLKAAKGYWGGKHRLYRPAAEAVDRAMAFAYRDRRAKKRDFRELWIVRINAGARANDISYSRLMSGLRKAGVEVNRKVLADLAATDQAAFTRLVAIAKENLGPAA